MQGKSTIMKRVGCHPSPEGADPDSNVRGEAISVIFGI